MITCDRCMWYRGDEDSGHCYYNPPTVLVNEGSVITAWPEVEADDFCSEGEQGWL